MVAGPLRHARQYIWVPAARLHVNRAAQAQLVDGDVHIALTCKRFDQLATSDEVRAALTALVDYTSVMENT